MKLPEKPPEWKKIFEDESREIFESINQKEILKTVSEYNKKYYYWNELKYRTEKNEDLKYLWTIMKLQRADRYEKIKFRPLNIKYTITSSIYRQLHNFDKSLAGNIETNSQKLGLEKKYIISSLMEEAIASSILEGAATTRKEAKEMLRTNRKPRTRSEMMVKNGYETMQMILNKKNEKLTPEFLLEIQTLITKDTLENEKDSGKFRDNNEVVVCDDADPSIIYHIPPDYKKIKNMISELCEFANREEDEFIHPIIKGAIIHFLIGYIHPFNDGNGRTARSIFYWYVLQKGYWLFEYMPLSKRILRSKTKYGLAYLHTEYDEMDLTYFIKYITECIEDTLEDFRQYLAEKQKEQQESLKMLEKLHDLNFRQVEILKKMMETKDKNYTINEISRIYHIVYQTARSDLQNLNQKGYISMKKIGKKFVFYFDENKNCIKNTNKSRQQNPKY